MQLLTGTQSRNTRHEPGVFFFCGDCGAVHPVQVSGGTGYGVDESTDRLFCYPCGAKRTRAHMEKTGRAMLYLTERKPDESGSRHKVTDWPGFLRFDAYYVHNFKASGFGGWHWRSAVRFVGPDGFIWSGTGPGVGMYLRAKRTKQRATR